MSKFILNIYYIKLQAYIAVAVDKTDCLKYLKNIYEVYSKYVTIYKLQIQMLLRFYFRTLQLSSDLSIFDIGNDKNFLNKLTNNIFLKYLDSYIR